MLRGMDRPTFDLYSDESLTLQETLSFFGATPELTPTFLRGISPPLLRLLARMFRMGDEVTAFLLARALGDLQEDRGLDEEAALSLQLAGRCARVLRFYAEGHFLLERSRRCAQRLHPSHPLLIETYNLLGLTCHFTGRLNEAESHYNRSMDLLEHCPGPALMKYTGRSRSRLHGMRLTNLLDLCLVKARTGSGVLRAAELVRARNLQSQVASDALGEPLVMGLNEANEGEILLVEGRVEEAQELLRQALHRYDSQDPAASHALPPMRRLLALAAAERGEMAEAYAHCQEGLKVSLLHANSLEEGLIVESTLQILGKFIRPRVTGAGVGAMRPEDRQVIQNLVQLLEGKDWYTGNNHSRAVSEMCRRVGVRLAATLDGTASAMDRVDEETVRMAGFLHDIGKLRIPWSLLNKRNPIVPFERRILESHVVEGGDMLRSLGFEDLARLVEEHHEKPDGTGYPVGRKDSSLMGAIIAVCDCFEAMITPNRRYAYPKTREQALHELDSHAGIQFDARVVAALRDVIYRKPLPQGAPSDPTSPPP